jgi:protein-tyrosine-phosphatase
MKLPFAIMTLMNIHFICRGNVLRSLIAETYTKSLNIDNVDVTSSGTNVNWNSPQERGYFADTLSVLDRHGIKSYVKAKSDQLTQERVDSSNDIIVLMNQRVFDEAVEIVKLPPNAINWEIIDIGEGHRTISDSRESYEEEIYQEITHKVDELLKANKVS